jgi:hypothetical protein
MRSLGRPVTERISEPSYLELQRQDDTVGRHALRRYSKGHYLREFPDDAIEAFLARGAAGERGDRLPSVGLQAYGGAIADVADGDAAFSHRDTLLEFGAGVSWTDPAEDQDRRAYPPAKLARLTAVKNAYDPLNVFHLNHNIRPASPAAPEV